MGLLRRLFKENALKLSSSSDGTAFRQSSVGDEDALRNSAFWSCVVNLCREYASLPWHVYLREGGSGVHVGKGLLPELLKNPCPYMDSYTWRFVMGFNYELRGMATAIVERSSTGLPINLYPVSPNTLRPLWADGHLNFQYHDGTLYPAEDVLRIMNTPIGYTSVLSPLKYAQDDIDIVTQSKKLQREYYAKGATIGNIISVPSSLGKEQREEIEAMFKANSGMFKNYILDERVKYQAIKLDTDDIKKIEEAQGWTVLEVARRFGVPPFFAGDLTKATYANSEQQGTQMVLYCLQPRVVSWETAIGNLIPDSECYVKFNLSGLMRGDHAARSAFYHNAILDGWMTINDVRRLEDMPVIGDNGDVHMFPLNYASLGDIIAGKFANQSNSYASERRIRTKETLSEKRRNDLAFIEASSRPAKSVKSRIEALVRTQLKAEISKMRELEKEGKPPYQAIEEFSQWIKANAEDFSARYQEVFIDILRKMVPIVQKQVATGQEVDGEKAEAFATSYAKSMANRHAGTVNKKFSAAVSDAMASGETLDTAIGSVSDDLLTNLPPGESEEESNRSANAFNLFLFQSLGVSYMHVVASANACEFCSKLDGKVASVNGSVLDKGDTVNDGSGNVRTIRKTYKHPPFHAHCGCGIAPGK